MGRCEWVIDSRVEFDCDYAGDSNAKVSAFFPYALRLHEKRCASTDLFAGVVQSFASNNTDVVRVESRAKVFTASQGWRVDNGHQAIRMPGKKTTPHELGLEA